MRTGGLTLVAVGVACAAVAGGAHAAPLSYNLQKLAETGSTYTSLGVPTVNDSGVVAFQAVDPAAGGRGVYYGTPAGVQRLATPGLNVSRNSSYEPIVGINNAGQIAFTALPPTNPNQSVGIDGVYRYNPAGGGSISTIAAPWSQSVEVIGGPVINDGGVVALLIWGPSRALATGDGSTPPSIQSLGASGTTVRDAHLSNDGHTSLISAGSFGGPNALRYDNRLIVTETSPGPFSDPSTGYPGKGTLKALATDIGDGGRVVFVATFAAWTTSLYVWENEVITRVPVGVGEGSVPAINDLGTVAALVKGTRDRLSIVKDGVEGTVISVGDAFDNSYVTGLTFVAEGFNDQDQLAFTAALADGRSVNVLATVPEPGSVGALVAVGAGTLLLRRRGRAR